MNHGSSSGDGENNVVRPMDNFEAQNVEAGVRKPAKLHDPRTPAPEEITEHNATHLPFRSWCTHCVRGKAYELACRRGAELLSVPETPLDFMFMGEETGGRWPTFLVVKERLSRAIMCTAVPFKSTGDFVAQRVVALIREFGCEYTTINMKADN